MRAAIEILPLPEGELPAILGEGAIYDARDDAVWWLDIKGLRLFRTNVTARATSCWKLPSQVSSIAVPTANWCADAGRPGTFLCTGEAGFATLRLEREAVKIHTLVHPEAHLPGNRFNDGKLGPDGRYYAGTMDDSEETASGTLYALSAAGKLDAIADGYRVPNGPAFAPDGIAIFHTDSARREIYLYPLTAGEIGERRLFHRFSENEGHPDGMCTSDDGSLYVAMWDGAAIMVLSAAGEAIGRIGVPTPRPTSCTFVPGGSRTLFVTTASIGLAAGQAEAGHPLLVTF